MMHVAATMARLMMVKDVNLTSAGIFSGLTARLIVGLLTVVQDHNM